MSQQQPVSGPRNGDRAAGLRISWAMIGGLAGGGALLAFVLQNRQDVTTTWLFWSFTWPLWLYTIVVAVLGSLVWIAAGILRRHRRRVARRATRRGEAPSG
ncbi:lipopolysaccharide assembly protein LapA domain-containing protein [Geodermatophilus marinus]|uniref:lipopolysaccharide assembly protein LapA domain-containing protein n=1 Tax=Geodermatophilus sp. LHW52908 TaxID=2303986 RepID=UPI000E3C3CB2|nr:LapA family protein [Geodermatophilus sp. LHW52908]RFU21378.1 LapA family protein [Geodermatophilus sp. LHW52908]